MAFGPVSGHSGRKWLFPQKGYIWATKMQKMISPQKWSWTLWEAKRGCDAAQGTRHATSCLANTERGLGSCHLLKSPPRHPSPHPGTHLHTCTHPHSLTCQSPCIGLHLSRCLGLPLCTSSCPPAQALLRPWVLPQAPCIGQRIRGVLHGMQSAMATNGGGWGGGAW